MPKGTESTTKFKADISELKSAMQQASRAVRLANSEFKAATSGMDDWSKSADGLSAKTKQLKTVLNAQLTTLGSLEKQYQLVAEAEGKDSKAAQDLQIKINNQKAVVNQTGAELSKYEDALENVGKETDDLGEKTEDAGEKAQKAANGGFTVLKGVLANLVTEGINLVVSGLKDLSGELVNIGKQAVANYADYEQLVGGVETLFGAQGMSLEEYAKSVGKSTAEVAGEYALLENAQRITLANADKAYKTAGMSANEYMENVTSFSASLISSLDGNTFAAAQAADQAIIDMSDNANKMGTDIGSIQNAYQGFAKQNYTMLDNLKLGYGGTKTEMERLLSDASKLSGVEYNIENLADVYEAVHVIQTEMGITGTTAKEASDTISGSTGSMSAAWQNLLTGIADDNADFDQLMENFSDSLVAFLGNMIPRIKTAIKGIGKLVTGLVENFLPDIIDLIVEEFPEFLKTGSDLLMTLMNGISEALPQLFSMAGEIILELVNGLIKGFPQFVKIAGQIISQMLKGISSAIPDLVDKICEIIPEISSSLIEEIPQLIELVAQIISEIIIGIAEILPELVDAVCEILPVIIDSLLAQLPTLLNAAITLLMAIVNAIPVIIQNLSSSLPQIVTTIVSALITALPTLIQAAITLFKAIIEAIPVIIDALGESLPQIIDTIVTALIEALPTILEGAITLLMAIIEAIPTIIDSLEENFPGIIDQIITSLIEALPFVLQAAITLLMALIDALPTIIRALVVNLPRLITTITRTLIQNLPVIIEASIILLEGLIKAIPMIISELAENLPDIIDALVEGLSEGIEDISDVGEDLIKGLWEGISDMASWIKDKISGFGEEILDDLKDFFGIESPSKLFRDEVGKWLPPGITVGFEEAMPKAIKEMASSAKSMATEIANEMSQPLEDMNISAAQAKNISGLFGSNGNSIGGSEGGSVQTINFNQTINSPKAVDRLTIFRDTNSLLFSAGVELNNV